MTRLSIEISAPASDEFMEQARVLLGAKPELDALVAKLESLGMVVSSSAGFKVTHERKTKAIPANPAARSPDTQIAKGPALGDSSDAQEMRAKGWEAGLPAQAAQFTGQSPQHPKRHGDKAAAD
jgi:hypothetical protein